MPRKKQEILALFQDAFDLTKELSDQQFGELMRAIGNYRFGGAKYTGNDFAIKMSFGFISAQVDRYSDYCQSKRAAANARYNNDSAEECTGVQETQNNAKECTGVHNDAKEPSISMSMSKSVSISDDNKADKPQRARFSPPTVEDVKAYCTEKNYSVDPNRFVDFYTSNGWMVGKNKMKDWRAAVRNWNGKEQSKNGKTESKPLWTIGTVV